LILAAAICLDHSNLLTTTRAVLRRGLIGDMTVPDPEALRRGVDTDGAIKQAMCPLRALRNAAVGRLAGQAKRRVTGWANLFSARILISRRKHDVFAWFFLMFCVPELLAKIHSSSFYQKMAQHQIKRYPHF
jgi:hypothetical protein